MRLRDWRSAHIIAVAGAIIALAALTSGTSAQAPHGVHVLVVPDTARGLLTNAPVTTVADYGSFVLVHAEGDEVARLVRAGASVRDDMNIVRIGDDDIDPLRDRAPLVGKGGSTVPVGEDALAIVQFAGPIKDSWYAALERSGVRIVNYQAQNAYLVHGTGAQLERAASVDGVRAAVAYTVADKLDGVGTAGGAKPVAVSTLSGGDGSDARAEVNSSGPRNRATYTVKGLSTTYADLTGAEARALADDPGVVAVEPDIAPTLHDEASSQIMAGTINGSFAPTGPGYLAWHDDPARGFNNPGLSSFVVDISDSGLDKGVLPLAAGSHPDFFTDGNPANTTRVAYMQEGTTDTNNEDCIGHGTHVASTATGFNNGTGADLEDAAGYNYGLGIAPRVRVGSTKVFNCAGTFNITGGATLSSLVSNAYANGARVGNNSWGAGTAGAYNTNARTYDALVRDAQDGVPGNQQIVEMFSAGNDGVPGDPTGGSASGLNTIGAPGVAKNVITVGASEGVRATNPSNCFDDVEANSARDIAPFSSRGPTDDGRVKPDIVAPGTHIISARSQAAGFSGDGICRVFPAGSTSYAESDGTSMATPQVTGAAALIRDWYRRTRGGGNVAPSPAMTKALLVNSATDLVGGDNGLPPADANLNAPSDHQGWGRANLDTLFDPSSARTLRDQSDLLGSTGTSTARTFTIDPTKPVRVTLAWTDAPGALTGNAFVNDLNLTVERGGDTFRGNFLASGVSVTGGSADALNNVENVFLPASGGATTMTVTVTAANIAGDGVPGNSDVTDQDYALVVTNGTTTGEGVVASETPATITDGGDGDGTFEPGERVRIAKQVANIGDGDATGISGSLSTALTPITTTNSYPSLAAGAVSSGTTPLEGRVPSAAACGSSIISTVTVTGPGGPIVETVPLRVGGTTAGVPFARVESPAVAIPDGLGANVPGAEAVSTLSIPAGAGKIGDLDITMDNLPHTFVGDLKLMLTSPAGTAVVLADRPGPTAQGSGRNNLTGVIFDDEAAAAVDEIPTSSTGTDVVAAGRYRPDQPLSAFDGQDAGGTWTLKITDSFNGDTGSVGGWTATVGNLVCSNPATTIADGATNVTTSSADLRGTAGAGGVPTSYRVDYGTSTAYGSSTTVGDAGEDGSATVSFAENVGGLSPGTEYHYRVVALRDGNVVQEGADSAFTTVALPAAGGGGGAPNSGGGGTPTPPNPPVTLGTISFSSSPKTVFATTKRKLSFKFTGTAGKKGKAAFTTKVKKKTVKLGTANYTLDAKGKATATVTLSKANYKALTKAKKQTVTATVTIDGRDFTKNFTLKPPKPKKKKK